jgi:hypothetical protein
VVGGNLINYKGDTSTQTADLTTSKLLWNSVLITDSVKHMCLDLTKKYLTAALDYLEYMKILLALFPEWIKSNTIWMFMPETALFSWRSDELCGDSPKWGVWPTDSCRSDSPPMGITNVSTLPGFGNMKPTQLTSPLWWMILELNIWVKSMWST